MRAIAVFPGQKDIRIVEHEPPALRSPAAAKVRVLEVGVCGTDREIAGFQYGTPPPGSDHLVIGHESLSEVVEVGPEVDRPRVGDLVVLMVRRPCPHAECPACRAGRQDFCVTGDFTERGIKGAHGYMTELVVDDARTMHVVPRELRDIAVLVEPLTIAEKALIQVRELQERFPWVPKARPGIPATGALAGCHRAVVLGAGPVGILGALALVAAGFETTVYSRQPCGDPKARLVESFGARYVSSETDTVEQLAERAGNIDLVYEATGASRLSFDVLEVLGTNGIFVFTGVPGRKAPIEVDTDLIMRNMVLRNQIVLGTVNAGPDAFAAATRDLGVFARRWPETVRALITSRSPMEEYRGLLLGDPQGIKNVITLV